MWTVGQSSSGLLEMFLHWKDFGHSWVYLQREEIFLSQNVSTETDVGHKLPYVPTCFVPDVLINSGTPKLINSTEFTLSTEKKKKNSLNWTVRSLVYVLVFSAQR